MAKIKILVLTILVIVILGFLLFKTACAQGIVSEEKNWNVVFSVIGVPLGTETYKIEGDSVFGGQDYKIIWWTLDQVEVQWSYMGLLRESMNIVYYVPRSGTEGILYDFNAEVEDTVWIKNMWCDDDLVPVVVTAIDTVEYFGIERKRWTLIFGSWGEEYWVEGIGSLNGPLNTARNRCVTGVFNFL